MKTALVCGVSGQDGALLARLLLSKGYRVVGTSRDPRSEQMTNLDRLGILPDVELLEMMPGDAESVTRAVTSSRADEVYYLSAQSSVGLSFAQPAETIRSSAAGTLNVLEAGRAADREIRMYFAGSSECFGDTGGLAATETTLFQPKSPYAVGKAAAHWMVDNYRKVYGLHASTGILFNHESPLRPPLLVAQKVVQGARRIAEGSREDLVLGRLDILRDWGWAPEYVEAMWLMLQQPVPEDYVIATGQSHTLQALVETAFAQLGLDYRAHVRQDDALYRPTDIDCCIGDPSKARDRLGWSARFDLDQMIAAMIAGDLD